MSAPISSIRSSGETVLPRDLDIFSIRPDFSERRVIIPWLNRSLNGSSKPTRPMSWSTRQMKRA